MNYTVELAQLMKFTGDTATAIRMYSAYNPNGEAQGKRLDPRRSPIDLMFLSDALHHFSGLGFALREANPAKIVAVCDQMLLNFADYETERPEYEERQAKPTFEFWRSLVNLKDAREAVASIRRKALSSQSPS